VKRIALFDRRYGTYALILGIIFIVANIIGGSFNFYLGNDGSDRMESLKEESIALWTLIYLPYYIATEYIPALGFALVMRKYGELV
jgi:membrane protein YqaA with SNARE-associated domain